MESRTRADVVAAAAAAGRRRDKSLRLTFSSETRSSLRPGVCRLSPSWALRHPNLINPAEHTWHMSAVCSETLCHRVMRVQQHMWRQKRKKTEPGGGLQFEDSRVWIFSPQTERRQDPPLTHTLTHIHTCATTHARTCLQEIRPRGRKFSSLSGWSGVSSILYNFIRSL